MRFSTFGKKKHVWKFLILFTSTFEVFCTTDLKIWSLSTIMDFLWADIIKDEYYYFFQHKSTLLIFIAVQATFKRFMTQNSHVAQTRQSNRVGRSCAQLTGHIRRERETFYFRYKTFYFLCAAINMKPFSCDQHHIKPCAGSVSQKRRTSNP